MPIPPFVSGRNPPSFGDFARVHCGRTVARMLARMILLAIAFAVAGGYLMRVDFWAAAVAFLGAVVCLVVAVTVGIKQSMQRRHERSHRHDTAIRA